MERQKRFVSEETLTVLRNAGIIDANKLVTIIDCVVWFAKHHIAIITDYCDITNEWDVLACGRVPGTREPHRSQSYIEAMNAAIRDAADEYIKSSQLKNENSDDIKI